MTQPPNALTRLSLAATVTAVFLLNGVPAEAKPNATPRPAAPGSTGKLKEGNVDPQKQASPAMTPTDGRKGMEQTTADKTSSKGPNKAPPPAQPMNVDLEVARVKREMREIQASSIPGAEKSQKQRALLDREMRRAQTQMRELKASDTKEAAEASRDRRKASLDNIQKFLDIVRSMNPQI